MKARPTDWIDASIDHGVAALFALACAFPALMLLADHGRLMAVLAVVLGLLAFVAARGLLRQIGGSRPSMFEFELAALPTADEPEVLELGEAERTAESRAEDGELVLDDILAAIDEDSRVVQLFGRQKASSPAELVDRIDRHLGDRSPASDDSGALFDALDKLRRSLR